MRFTVYIFWLLIPLCVAKIYEKCELATIFRYKHQMSLEEVKNWVCIAEFESTFNTQAINHDNWDGSKDYGLLQLNNRYWCGSKSGKNVCGIPCEALLDDDLTDDLHCAQKVIDDTVLWSKKKNGFIAWAAYVSECQDRNLTEYMEECMAVIETPPSIDTTDLPVEEPQTTLLPDVEAQTSTVPPRGSGLGQIKPSVSQEFVPESPTTLTQSADDVVPQIEPLQPSESQKPFSTLTINRLTQNMQNSPTLSELVGMLQSAQERVRLQESSGGEAGSNVASQADKLPLFDESYPLLPAGTVILSSFPQYPLPDSIPHFHQGINSAQIPFVPHYPGAQIPFGLQYPGAQIPFGPQYPGAQIPFGPQYPGAQIPFGPQYPGDLIRNYFPLHETPQTENQPVEIPGWPNLPATNEMEYPQHTNYKPFIIGLILVQTAVAQTPTPNTIIIQKPITTVSLPSKTVTFPLLG